MTDLTHEFVATRRQLLGQPDAAALMDLFSDYETQGDSLLARGRGGTRPTTLHPHMDLRYRGQSHELTVTVPAGALTAPDGERLLEQFHEAHARAYGYAAREDAVELVNVRLTAIGVSPKPQLKALPHGTGNFQAAVKGQRQVWFGEIEEFALLPVVDRYRLCWGDEVPGPAVVEELDSTTVHPSWLRSLRRSIWQSPVASNVQGVTRGQDSMGCVQQAGCQLFGQQAVGKRDSAEYVPSRA